MNKPIKKIIAREGFINLCMLSLLLISLTANAEIGKPKESVLNSDMVKVDGFRQKGVDSWDERNVEVVYFVRADKKYEAQLEINMNSSLIVEQRLDFVETGNTVRNMNNITYTMVFVQEAVGNKIDKDKINKIVNNLFSKCDETKRHQKKIVKGYNIKEKREW